MSKLMRNLHLHYEGTQNYDPFLEFTLNKDSTNSYIIIYIYIYMLFYSAFFDKTYWTSKS